MATVVQFTPITLTASPLVGVLNDIVPGNAVIVCVGGSGQFGTGNFEPGSVTDDLASVYDQLIITAAPAGKVAAMFGCMSHVGGDAEITIVNSAGGFFSNENVALLIEVSGLGEPGPNVADANDSGGTAIADPLSATADADSWELAFVLRQSTDGGFDTPVTADYVSIDTIPSDGDFTLGLNVCERTLAAPTDEGCEWSTTGSAFSWCAIVQAFDPGSGGSSNITTLPALGVG